MHTHKAGDTIFHHNGDFSGDVKIVLYTEPKESPVPAEDGRRWWEVEVPFEDLRSLVAEYVRGRRIELLEQASDDGLFGIAESFEESLRDLSRRVGRGDGSTEEDA